MNYLPSGRAIAQGVIVTIAAGLVAAWMLSKFPELRRYMQGGGASGCGCRD